MDAGALIGLVVAVGAILGSTLMDGGSLGALISPSALVLVVGGTLGATIVSTGLREVLSLVRVARQITRAEDFDAQGVIDDLVRLSQKARREGLLALEGELGSLGDPFLVRGLQMVVDGNDVEAVRSVLEMDIALMERRHAVGAQVFETAGGFAPTMGIIGTVMGLIHVLSNLNNSQSLGQAIATAFLATFYGISTANVFWLPVASKLKTKTQREVDQRELLLEGILSIQRGDNPSAVREKLSVFLPPAVPDEEDPEAAEPAPAGVGVGADQGRA